MKKNVFKKEEIVSIEEIDYEGYVYDACCDAPHLYLTNDFISHNCVLFVDEIEKSISGIKSSGSTDGGTTSRVLSTFLTWMQERDKPVFVVATANSHESIPAEFLRAGRFDEIFFVDLPDQDEREEIFSVLLKKKNLNVESFDVLKLAKKTEKYSGAEIEKSIDKAMILGFHEGEREITTEDVLKASKEFKPLSVMREDDFAEMSEWAEANCVSASIKDDKSKKNNSLTSQDINIDI